MGLLLRVPFVLMSPTALFMMKVLVLCPPTIAKNRMERACLLRVEELKNDSVNPTVVFAVTLQS